jgi:hypothetical protein
MAARKNSWSLVAFAAVALAGCLPKDTRPPPARVLLSASPGDALANASTTTPTEDGWQLSFQRVLIALGRASLDGDRCSTYSEARYTRVLSLVAAPPTEKISESFALGHCDFGVGVTSPDGESLLGPTATADDLALLRTLGSDKYAGSSGISFYVQGRATRADELVTFAWKFRGRIRLEQCADVIDGKPVPGLDLAEDDDVNVDVTIEPELLFSDTLDPTTAELRFDAIAAADRDAGDANGEVTLDELGLVPISSLQNDAGAYSPGDSGLTFTTLEDFVYAGAAPNVPRYRGTGKCQAQLRPPRGHLSKANE